MDTSHWSQPQGNINNIGLVKPILEEGSSGSSRSLIERRTRPQKDQALNCPRCNSTNTKFCYYNNYSLSQPRFICKTCKRYWTEGGSLRNVPVGGGSRKNKRSSTSSSPSNSSKKLIASSFFPQLSASDHQNPKIEQGQDLNLAYPPTEDNDNNNNNNFESFSRLVEVPNYENILGSTSSSTNNSSHVSAMELFKSAGIGSRGLMTSFMPMGSNNEIFSSGLIPNLEEFKPNLNFGVDGFESGYGVADHDNICSNARLLFPTNEDHLKQQVSSTSTTTTEFVNDQQNRGQGGNFAGYWNGMLGGGSW